MIAFICDGIALFYRLSQFFEHDRAFIFAQPLLFVLATGFIITVGSDIGETIVYWMPRMGERSLVYLFSSWLRLDPRHTYRAEALFLHRGIGLVVLGCILPGVWTAVSVPAGMTRMHFTLLFSASFGGAYL